MVNTIAACDPCGCIPGNISNDKFKQDVEAILCKIVTNTSSGIPPADLATIEADLAAIKTAILALQTDAEAVNSIYRRISTADTNAAVVKNTAGTLAGWHITNTNAAVRYLKIYDKATTPTVGSDTPKLTLAIPGSVYGAGSTVTLPKHVAFTNGIGIALTTAATDADTGAVAANEILVNLFYR